MTLKRYLFLMPLAVTLANQVNAQVELFGPDQAAVVEGIDDSSTEPALADNDPLLRQLLEQAGRGNEQLAASIGSLARLARWKEVEQLLIAIPAKQLDEPTLAKIFLTIGPANYLKLKQPNLLNEEATKSLDTLQQAATKYSQSSERILQAINNLTAQDEDAKLEATRVLLSGGSRSVELLVASCCQPQPKLKLNRMLSTLTGLGGGGRAALRQISLYGNAESRKHAIESLAKLDLEQNLIDIATAAHAQDSTQEERRLAEQLLNKIGFPSRSETLQALTLDFRRLLATAKQQNRDQQIQAIWSINETRDGVTSQPTPMYLVRYRDVYDAAARLQRFGQITGDLKSQTVLQTISYQMMADPDWGDESQITAAVKQFDDLGNPSGISTILSTALNQEEIAGAIALIRMVSSGQWSKEQVKQFIMGTAGAPSPLARAAVNANTQLRFEAAAAITKLAETENYAGVSQVHRTLSEMTRLDDQPSAILIETRPDVLLTYEKLLRSMGYGVKNASSVAQAQRLVDQGGDLRLVLAKQQLSDRTVLELIDTVRRTHRGRNIPIAIFGENEMDLGSRRWRAPTVFLFEPMTEVTIGRVLQKADEIMTLPQLSSSDRSRLKEQAESLLSR